MNSEQREEQRERRRASNDQFGSTEREERLSRRRDRSVVLAYYILLTLGNSLDYITNIQLMQSPAQHQKIMPCQVGQLQGRCFLRLPPMF